MKGTAEVAFEGKTSIVHENESARIPISGVHPLYESSRFRVTVSRPESH
jgi:hypothetical protein